MQVAPLFELLKIVTSIVDLIIDLAQIICYGLYVIQVMRNLKLHESLVDDSHYNEILDSSMEKLLSR